MLVALRVGAMAGPSSPPAAIQDWQPQGFASGVVPIHNIARDNPSPRGFIVFVARRRGC